MEVVQGASPAGCSLRPLLGARMPCALHSWLELLGVSVLLAPLLVLPLKPRAGLFCCLECLASDESSPYGVSPGDIPQRGASRHPEGVMDRPGPGLLGQGWQGRGPPPLSLWRPLLAVDSRMSSGIDSQVQGLLALGQSGGALPWSAASSSHSGHSVAWEPRRPAPEDGLVRWPG